MIAGKSILIYGYGNPGRQDDGLGNEFVEIMEKWIAAEGIKNVFTDSNYQLNIEDADTISSRDIVVFVDATTEEIEDFYINRVEPSEAKVEFTMHAVSPAFVVNLCNDIYGKFPECFLIHIKGYEWEFQEGLTDKAKANLLKALEFVKQKILNGDKFLD
ncbi:MAG: hydrogenase maturation protease [Bacteroidales bacterium]|nr:hydrogenase maturation protease [Bacteroidales bacterium]HQP03339.1 hydrogenase maturation protease [Bacteroidales bacterium]